MNDDDREAHAQDVPSSFAGPAAPLEVASGSGRGNAHRPGSTAPPRVLVRAFSLWLFVVVLGLVETVASIADGDATFAGYGPTAQVAAVLRVVVIVVVSVVSVGWWIVEIVAAFRLRGGRRGARVVLTVLGSITLLINVLSMAADVVGLVTSPDESSISGVADGLLLLAQTAIVVIALILMHRPAATAYLQPTPASMPEAEDLAPASDRVPARENEGRR